MPTLAFFWFSISGFTEISFRQNHLNVSLSLEKWNITVPRCTGVFPDLALKRYLFEYQVLLNHKLLTLYVVSVPNMQVTFIATENLYLSVAYQCKRMLCTSHKKKLLCAWGCLDLYEKQSICLDHFGVSNCWRW